MSNAEREAEEEFVHAAPGVAGVVCDGRSAQDPLGHPRVFLAFDRTSKARCPYCGRRFRRQVGAVQ